MTSMVRDDVPLLTLDKFILWCGQGIRPERVRTTLLTTPLGHRLPLWDAKN